MVVSHSLDDIDASSSSLGPEASLNAINTGYAPGVV
jgi:hypothetical protein